MDVTAQFVRKDFSRLPKYAAIKPLEVLATELHCTIDDLVKLDANENPYGPVEEIRKALADAEHLNIYPDPLQLTTREKIAKYIDRCLKSQQLSGNLSINLDHIICGSGSDEILELLIKLILTRGEPENAHVITCSPTFGMYSFLANTLNATYVDVPRGGAPHFEVKVEKLLNQMATAPSARKLVFLASPNNPTGKSIKLSDVERLCAAKNALIVVDQAYAEFDMDIESPPSEEKPEDCNSILTLLEKYPNLVVVRTFSKWSGLAGVRSGYAIAHPSLVEKIIALKQPFNFTVPAGIVAQAALDNFDKIMTTQVKPLLKETKRMASSLMELGWLEPMPTVANYVLCKVSGEFNAADLTAELKKMGVLIRHYPGGTLDDFVRISTGTARDTDRLIFALKSFESSSEVQSKKSMSSDSDMI